MIYARIIDKLLSLIAPFFSPERMRARKRKAVIERADRFFSVYEEYLKCPLTNRRQYRHLSAKLLHLYLAYKAVRRKLL